MSNGATAEIEIGGRLPVSRFNDFCAAIETEGVGLDWGEYHVDKDELLAVIAQGGSLRLMSDLADWGEMPHLEAFCRAHHLSYCRRSGPLDGYDPEEAVWAPRMDAPDVRVTNSNGEPVITLAELKAFAAQQMTAEQIVALFDKSFTVPPFVVAGNDPHPIRS